MIEKGDKCDNIAQSTENENSTSSWPKNGFDDSGNSDVKVASHDLWNDCCGIED